MVRGLDGVVAVDPSGRLAGRGAYVCANPACIETAITKGALQRALGAPVPTSLRAQLETSALSTDQGGIRGQE